MRLRGIFHQVPKYSLRERTLFFYNPLSRPSLWVKFYSVTCKTSSMLHSQTQGQTPISLPKGLNSQAHSFISFTSDLNNHLTINTFLVTGEKICLHCSIRETRFIVGVLRFFLVSRGFFSLLFQIWKQAVIFSVYNMKPFLEALKEETLLPVWQQNCLQPMAMWAKISS